MNTAGVKSQNATVLEYMKTSTITPMTALERFGIMRLASRIHDLKQQGYGIKTKMRYTNISKYAEYSLDIKE